MAWEKDNLQEASYMFPHDNQANTCNIWPLWLIGNHLQQGRKSCSCDVKKVKKKKWVWKNSKISTTAIVPIFRKHTDMCYE